MAPTQPTEGSRWSMNNLHEKTTWDTSLQEKKDIYAAWASSYEHDLSFSAYVAPDTIANMTLRLIKSSYLPSASVPVKILDAGCGTGLVGHSLKKAISETPYSMDLTGVDFSNDMLLIAKGKDCYHSLAYADLNERISVPDDSQDFVVCCGVYLQGHCGPSTIPNVLRTIRPGGYFITTIRNSVFEKDKYLYLKNIQESGFEVISNELRPYLGPVTANFLTCRKLE